MTSEYMWRLEAYEQHGKLWLKYYSDAPFNLQRGQLKVYKDDNFPKNPQDPREIAASLWAHGTNPVNTSLDWGTGWYCAWVAESPKIGGGDPTNIYVVQLVTDSSMGPDVAKTEVETH